MSDLNAQPVESTFDALDGSSTGTRVSSNWVISLQANDSRELGNPNGNGAICEAITRPNMRFVATEIRPAELPDAAYAAAGHYIRY